MTFTPSVCCTVTCASSEWLLLFALSLFPLQTISVCLSHAERNTRHAIPPTMRAWLISVSLPCFRKVSGQERPFERHFNPNYVDLKTALTHEAAGGWGAGWGGVKWGWWIELDTWIFMSRHLKHILPWVTTGEEQANQLLLRRILTASALRVT